MGVKERENVRELAQAYLNRGDATGWFEALYAKAGDDLSIIPWADNEVNPLLLEWLGKTGLEGRGKLAITVGCGLGEDAEELSRRGFRVTGFDISPTAISWCKRRFPQSTVAYTAADLFHHPASWNAAFDFVFESNTLQALPLDRRAEAIKQVASLVAPGGALLVIARGRGDDEKTEHVPWPLSRHELNAFHECGLREETFEDYQDHESPPVRRFRVTYRKA